MLLLSAADILHDYFLMGMSFARLFNVSFMIFVVCIFSTLLLMGMSFASLFNYLHAG